MVLIRKLAFLLLGSTLTSLGSEASATEQNCTDCVSNLWNLTFPEKILPTSYRIAEDSLVLINSGKAKQQKLNNKNIKLLLWNAGKCEDPSWLNDFEHLSKASDLFLIQEAILDPKNNFPLSKSQQKSWTMAASFYNQKGIASGVATGSAATPTHQRFLRSVSREFLANTPKMALVTDYSVKGNQQKLRVINVHAINFRLSTAEHFQKQLNQIEKALEEHKGPIILAGDFNTWSPERLAALFNLAKKYHLLQATPKNDPRWFALDHIFTRGMKIRSVELLGKVKSSDHRPIQMEIASIEASPSP